MLSLSLAVDSDVSSFTDPTDPSWSVKDPNTGNVYVALGTDAPVNATTNNYSVQLLYSSTTLWALRSASSLTVSRETTAGSPQLTVEQGGPGSGVNTPGQVAIVWDNFAAATSTAARSRRGCSPPPRGRAPHGDVFGPEVAAFTSIPTVGTTSGFSVVSGTPGVSSSNYPHYPVDLLA